MLRWREKCVFWFRHSEIRGWWFHYKLSAKHMIQTGLCTSRSSFRLRRVLWKWEWGERERGVGGRGTVISLQVLQSRRCVIIPPLLPSWQSHLENILLSVPQQLVSMTNGNLIKWQEWRITHNACQSRRYPVQNNRDANSVLARWVFFFFKFFFFFFPWPVDNELVIDAHTNHWSPKSPLTLNIWSTFYAVKK